MFSISKQHNFITTNWKIFLENLYKNNIKKSKFKLKIDKLEKSVNQTETEKIFPPLPLIFYAFNHFNHQDLKVVIIGQDPYHKKGQAMGLSFSVLENIKTPPSLRNIFKELNNDLGIKRTNPNLTDWAEQGVLLLNSSLTVKEASPNIHQKLWEFYTDTIITEISKEKNNIIFLLWGNFARNKKSLIDTDRHIILEAAHPSPLSASRGWFGSKHFSKTNQILKENNKREIKW